LDRFHAASLEGNPAGGPVERHAAVYLPPGYFENERVSYPVIYLLHGYAGNYKGLTVTQEPNKYAGVLTPEILKEFSEGRMTGYTTLDGLISKGELPPFILVQPDGSLHLPHSGGVKDMFTGETATKGSFYINSPFTGRYEDYIANDVVSYIEDNYRVARGPGHRALAGVSMGGYGALSICLNNPGRFAAVAALSPANFTLESISWKLCIPVVERLLGRDFAETSGAANWADILDTVDLVYSGNRRLLPTVRKREGGNIMSCDEQAAANWEKHNLNVQIKSLSNPFNGMAVLINCHRDDEFGLAPEAERLHASLFAKGVEHLYELYSDTDAALTTHMLGIAYHVGPAIRFCLERLS
jgi:enterochelin esterase-like enzyme